jgi:hypothetical protein
MSKAEEKAVEYQIKTHGPNVMGGASMLSEEEYMRFNMNLDFKNGYELAEKDLGWHSVDECLPEINEEVIALTNQMNGKTLDTARRICYAHRPDPKGWDGRSLDTGEVKHYDVVTYDGWNIPGVKFWMPLPKIPEE